MWATSNVFLPGHQVRLDIAGSSSFPRYQVNTNTGGIIAEEDPQDGVPTALTVYRDWEHPTHLVLPVIPARAASRTNQPPPAINA